MCGARESAVEASLSASGARSLSGVSAVLAVEKHLAQNRTLQKLAIQSLYIYAACCRYFVVVAPPEVHENSKMCMCTCVGLGLGLGASAGAGANARTGKGMGAAVRIAFLRQQICFSRFSQPSK